MIFRVQIREPLLCYRFQTGCGVWVHPTTSRNCKCRCAGLEQSKANPLAPHNSCCSLILRFTNRFRVTSSFQKRVRLNLLLVRYPVSLPAGASPCRSTLLRSPLPSPFTCNRPFNDAGSSATNVLRCSHAPQAHYGRQSC